MYIKQKDKNYFHVCYWEVSVFNVCRYNGGYEDLARPELRHHYPHSGLLLGDGGIVNLYPHAWHSHYNDHDGGVIIITIAVMVKIIW